MTTEKENYLSLLAGEIPEWIPNQLIGPVPWGKHEPAMWLFEPPLVSDFRMKGGGFDVWGVEYIATESAGGAIMPSAEHLVLPDISEWRERIVAPDISNVDWKKMAEDHLAQSGIDRTQTALAFNTHIGYFQNLIAFMGFTEGLLAMYEEPDEVYALFDYISDFYCEVTENIMKYYKPDTYMMFDDTAAWQAPFISAEMYHELCAPFYHKQAQFAKDAGIPIIMHNCGMAACFADDWVDIGVRVWDPAQTCNDLDDFKERYGDKIVIGGGWDAIGDLGRPDVTEKQIWDSVDATFNRLAKGGGYCFVGSILGDFNDPETARLNTILFDAVDELGHAFYK